MNAQDRYQTDVLAQSEYISRTGTLADLVTEVISTLPHTPNVNEFVLSQVHETICLAVTFAIALFSKDFYHVVAFLYGNIIVNPCLFVSFFPFYLSRYCVSYRGCAGVRNFHTFHVFSRICPHWKSTNQKHGFQRKEGREGK
jgi:hypothetical protein